MARNPHFLDPVKKKKGVRMPLLNPDGSFSDDFIMVRWAWCDEMRAAKTRLKREMRQKFTEGVMSDEDSQAIVDEGIVIEVAGWGGPSFKHKATKKAVREFFQERPDVAELVDKVSGNTELFFSDKEDSS